MKMKKTLIAMAAVILLASVAQAALEEYYFGPRDKNKAVKVDGNEKVRWPFEYKELIVCSIPVKMSLGMWVEVEKCTDSGTKIVLEQVDCGDIGKGGSDWPCYLDCVKFRVRANFEVDLGAKLTRNSAGEKVIDNDKWGAYYNSGEIIPNDGEWHEAEVCLKVWKAKLYKGTPGDEVTLGTLDITAKPNV
jgi:hypothetical protein